MQRQTHIAQRREAVAQQELGKPHVGQLSCVVARQQNIGRLQNTYRCQRFHLGHRLGLCLHAQDYILALKS